MNRSTHPATAASLSLDQVLLEILQAARQPLDCAQLAHRGGLWLSTTPIERSAALGRLIDAGLVRRALLPQREWAFPLLEASPRVAYEAVAPEVGHASN